jgi:release factor glutamine methyltransferase
MTTVATALAAARAKLPASEARLLLGHVLGQSATWVLAHDDEVLEEDALLVFASLVARRAGGEPVAYLAGYREFFGRKFVVSPAVLIPRPETELLVEVALAGMAASESPRILDMGTGSGCIAITLALESPSAKVSAIDSSEAALTVARRNAELLGAYIDFRHSDWFESLGGQRFDVIVANPPYIAAADPHLAEGDLRCEPLAALCSGADGLDALRRIIAAAPAHLTSGGTIWLEHGYDQAGAVRELLSAAGLTGIEQHRDLAGIVRVSGAHKATVTIDA